MGDNIVTSGQFSLSFDREYIVLFVRKSQYGKSVPVLRTKPREWESPSRAAAEMVRSMIDALEGMAEELDEESGGEG